MLNSLLRYLTSRHMYTGISGTTKVNDSGINKLKLIELIRLAIWSVVHNNSLKTSIVNGGWKLVSL